MEWKFDQAANVACLTCQAVLDGSAVLAVTHYSDDDSWAFVDGLPVDESQARVVSMGSMLQRHPDLHDIAGLPPGQTATRAAVGMPWQLAPHT